MEGKKRLTEKRETPLTMSMWGGSIKDLRVYNRLAEYENDEESGKIVRLPCKVGDTIYTNWRLRGDYLRKKDAPFPVKVVFIGINDYAPHGGGFINVEYKTGRQWQFNFADFGKIVFLTREEAKGGDNEKQET